MPETKRIIITGAPGTGKSTILDLLARQNYPVHPEMARALIAEEQKIGSEVLPWKDHRAFGERLFLRQREQYFKAFQGKVNFYDRGIPDNLGYLRRDNLQNPKLEEEALQYPYFSKVFLTPPWEDIYNRDEERWEDFGLMLEIHEALMDIYRFYKYQIVEVPRTSAPNRLDFILQQLGL